MQSFHEFLEEAGNSQSKDAKAIRNGIGIRDTFWDDFLLLLNDAEAVSSLLKVPVEKVGTWHEIIKRNLESVYNSDNELVPKKNKKLLKTGLPEDL